MAKKMKMNFKKVAENTLIVAATGAGAQIVGEAIDLKQPEIIDYAFMGIGVILPEIVKAPAVATAGNALLAIGAYKTAQRYNLAGKLGFNTLPPAAKPPAAKGIYGLYGNHDVIGSGNWASAREVYASAEKTEKKNQVIK